MRSINSKSITIFGIVILIVITTGTRRNALRFFLCIMCEPELLRQRQRQEEFSRAAVSRRLIAVYNQAHTTRLLPVPTRGMVYVSSLNDSASTMRKNIKM